MRRRFRRWLTGYDSNLEFKRQAYFDQFWQTEDPDERREAMRGAGSLTALRSATFVLALERSLGIPDE